MTVQGAGGLPSYICQIAKAIKRTGKTTSQAIAIAVSRVKKWAAGADNVDAKTRAKAAKAVAEWEKLKAKSKAKDVVKTTNRVYDTLVLANTSFNVESVKSAWDQKQRDARKAYFKLNPSGSYDDAPSAYSWIKEQWTDYLIVTDTSYGASRSDRLFKVPYAVDKSGQVSFEDPVEVKTEYVTVKAGDMAGDEISTSDLQALMSRVGPCPKVATDQVMLSLTPRPSALDQVLALAMDKPYGNVSYADPGYKEGKKRYPIDTAAHVRAAWSYINQEKNQGDYTAAQVAAIKGRIRSAAKKFNVEISG